jgi:hypothetical protein
MSKNISKEELEKLKERLLKAFYQNDKFTINLLWHKVDNLAITKKRAVARFFFQKFSSSKVALVSTTLNEKMPIKISVFPEIFLQMIVFQNFASTLFYEEKRSKNPIPGKIATLTRLDLVHFGMDPEIFQYLFLENKLQFGKKFKFFRNLNPLRKQIFNELYSNFLWGRTFDNLKVLVESKENFEKQCEDFEEIFSFDLKSFYQYEIFSSSLLKNFSKNIRNLVNALEEKTIDLPENILFQLKVVIASELYSSDQEFVSLGSYPHLQHRFQQFFNSPKINSRLGLDRKEDLEELKETECQYFSELLEFDEKLSKYLKDKELFCSNH